MKHLFLFTLCAAALIALAGCASENPSSGGSIGPSGSSTGSLGTGQ